MENRLSIVPEPRGKGKRYDEWLENRRKPSQRETLRIALDEALARKPADLEALLHMLQYAGWEIKRGKHIALRRQGEKRFKRLDSLSDPYNETALLAILSGQKEYTPKQKRWAAHPAQRVNLLVDIQQKLREGKGTGYERWAARFNSKELANTLNFISENSIADFDDLVRKAEAATVHANELLDSVRQMEDRLREIRALQTHIFDYLKTKDVFSAYRASGYSRKFTAAHERELSLRKAAKAAFDELGAEKLPTLQTLRSEYAALLEKKKNAYRQYRQARDEMRNLIRAKANVEMILENGAAQEQPPKRGQRKTETAR